MKLKLNLNGCMESDHLILKRLFSTRSGLLMQSQ